MRQIAIAGVLLAATVPATAATIFDSQALGEPLCQNAAYTCVTNKRDSYYNFAAVLHFSADTTVNQIGVYAAIGDPQNVDFLIFASKYDASSGDPLAGKLLFSQTKSFGAQGLGYIYTDPIAFTFLAGRTYDVGIIGTGHSLTGRYVTPTDPNVTKLQLSSLAVTEYSANANIGYYAFDPTMPATTGFNHPFTGGYSDSVSYIQLNTTAIAVTGGAPTPEPATWALLIVGFGLVGMARRREAATA